MKTMLLHILTTALVLGGAAGLAQADSGLHFSLALDRGGPAISVGVDRYVADAGHWLRVPPPPHVRHVAPPPPPSHRHPMRRHFPRHYPKPHRFH